MHEGLSFQSYVWHGTHADLAHAITGVTCDLICVCVCVRVCVCATPHVLRDPRNNKPYQ